MLVEHSSNDFTVCVSRGAGQEVGRSCIILEFKGRKIMVTQPLFLFVPSSVNFNVSVQSRPSVLKHLCVCVV